MLPVHQILRCRVPPGHILPLGAIGVPLIAEMPYTILVEHTVGVVHPAVGRGVMVDGTEFFTVCGVERVAQPQILPHGVVGSLAHRVAPLRGDDVEHHLVASVGGEVERHIVVGLRAGQARHDSAVELAVDEDIYAGFIVGVLDGEQQIRAVGSHAHQGIGHAQRLHFHTGSRRESLSRSGEQCGRKKQIAEYACFHRYWDFSEFAPQSYYIRCGEYIKNSANCVNISTTLKFSHLMW